jgi:hypothetical protein
VEQVWMGSCHLFRDLDGNCKLVVAKGHNGESLHVLADNQGT